MKWEDYNQIKFCTYKRIKFIVFKDQEGFRLKLLILNRFGDNRIYLVGQVFKKAEKAKEFIKNHIDTILEPC